jgi:hypothetical protein
MNQAYNFNFVLWYIWVKYMVEGSCDKVYYIAEVLNQISNNGCLGLFFLFL